MKGNLLVLKFEIKKTIYSPVFIVFFVMMLAVLVFVSILGGSLVKEDASSRVSPQLSSEEVLQYKEKAKELKDIYLIASGRAKELSGDRIDEVCGEYNTEISAQYYMQEALFYEALAEQAQHRSFAANDAVWFGKKVASRESVFAEQLIQYTIVAGICMILVGMFIGIYSFGNDKIGDGIKNILASGIQRKNLFFGQLFYNGILIFIIWLIFMVAGLISYRKGIGETVYSLYHTKCAVMNAGTYYLVKMLYGLLAAMLSSAVSALATFVFKRAGLSFIGVPVLMLFGGGVFWMMSRTLVSSLSIAATRAPLVGLPFMPVVGKTGVVVSLLLQSILTVVLFVTTYHRQKRMDF